MSDFEDFENVPAETPLSPEQAIIRRHRKEKKELQGRIVAMKKAVTKNDKKKKKELADEIAKLEEDLESRHKAELDTFMPKRVTATNTAPDVVNVSIQKEKDTVDSCSEQEEPSGVGVKLSKAQKRRERKAALEKERQTRVEQETAALVEDAEWKVEDEKLVKILSTLNLEVHDIPSDGHCLYRAIAHQLNRHSESLTVDDLRRLTAKHLLENKEDFVNYLDETEIPQEYEEYCKNVESTAVWGGQVEIKALSQLLKRQIQVIQAEGPPLLFGNSDSSDELVLSYHRHKFKLGAHYNSIVPAQQKLSDSEFQEV